MPAKQPSEAPPDQLVKLALVIANRSPCAKSKRGVVAYVLDDQADHSSVVGTGHNGPPGYGLTCDGSLACRDSCPKRCIHAEQRALWQAAPLMVPHVPVPAARGVHLIHVEIEPKLIGKTPYPIVACDGPKCWQCSRQLLDVGAAGIWLWEAMPADWCPHLDQHVHDCPLCQGSDCTYPHTDGKPCDHAADERHHGLPVVDARWRYYDSERFHRVTSERCNVHH